MEFGEVEGEGPFDLTESVLKQLRRRIAWDLFPHEEIEQCFSILEMTPSGDDVFTMEHTASHERIDQCVPLVPFTEVYVTLVNDLLNKVLLNGVEMPDDVKEHMNRQNLTIMRNGLYTVLYQLLDTGLLTYGRNIKG